MFKTEKAILLKKKKKKKYEKVLKTKFVKPSKKLKTKLNQCE